MAKFRLTDRFLFLLYDSYEILEQGVFDPLEFITKPRGPSSIMVDSEYERTYKELRRRKRRKRFSQFIYYLKKQGYIRPAQLAGKQGVLLTKKGRRKALRYKHLSSPKNKKSQPKPREDGKWLMVIFDIPEKLKKNRDIFRDLLQGMGFKKLQISVWICPFDVASELERIILEYDLEAYVRIFLIEEIEAR